MLMRFLSHLLAAWTRLRLASAEQDLAWLQHQTPQIIARQRAKVRALRRQANARAPRIHRPNSQAIATRACTEKRELLA
jgi:hypothetical protein